MNWVKNIILFYTLFNISQGVSGQNQASQEIGLPLVKNYPQRETGGHSQNWDIVQDNRGVMYFANTDGILEYDGTNWRLIRNPTGLVFSLSIDDNNTIYAGTKDDIGYLTPDLTGELQFESLRSRVDEAYSDFGNVRRTFATNEGVYFVASKYIFLWSDQTMKVWKSNEASFHISAHIDETLYVRQPGVGLMRLTGDSVELVPGGDFFADRKIYFIEPYLEGGDNSLLIGTDYDGLFHYSNGQVTTFPTVVDSELKKNWAYHCVILPDSTYAISTILGGLLVIDIEGELKYSINRATGLQNDGVNKAFVDKEGTLWLALQNGIAKVDVSSPLTFFSEFQGVNGYVEDIKRFDDALYMVSNTGFYRLNKNFDTQLWSLETLNDQLDRAWWLLEVQNALLIATSSGIYQYSNGRIDKLKGPEVVGKMLYPSRQSSDIVYAGTTNGLYVLELTGNNWRIKGKVDNVQHEIHYVHQEEDVLWLGTFHKGVYRLEIDPNNVLKTKKVSLYDTLHGLPSMVENIVTSYNGEKVFPTHHGIYQFDQSDEKFVPDFSFGDQFGNGTKSIFHFVASDGGGVWMHMWDRDDVTRNTGYLKPLSDNTFDWQNKAFAGQNRTGIFSVYNEDNGVTWFGSIDLLIRHDGNKEKNFDFSFNTLVRRVSVGQDSLIYGGATVLNEPELPYSSNAIRFEFSTTSFDYSEQNQFQYWLEGFDSDWSLFTTETQKDYTNLPEGNYTFRVRAKNVYRNLGNEDSYSFQILPPWYRTWWAYAIYIATFLGCLQLIITWRSKKLQSEKAALERTIDERTKEIAQKNLQLEQQTEKLKEIDKLKSNFFANISHEFRTPLTLIRGPLDAVRSGDPKELTTRHLDMMRRNADRLLRLVNQLLDLSKLESGTLKLEVSNKDVVSFTKGLCLSFETLAIERFINLKVISNEPKIHLYFDRDKLEKILYNLLSNAFKFTDNKGTITVEIVDEPEDVLIKVKDSGIGISKEKIPHLFDRFYQVDDSSTRNREGSGIGLALVKELTELHHGEIHVESNEGQGTVFTIKLLKGAAHLERDEIIAPEEDESHMSLSLDVGHTEEGVIHEHTAHNPDHLVILVVEDNSDVRRFITEQLAPHYEIKEASNGEEGYELARDIIPDLIVSDLMMPKVDGLELTSKIKKDVRTSHIPVILLTAKAESKDKISGLETGADDYLTKPFEGKELIARINNLIKVRVTLWERISRELAMKPSDVSEPSLEEQFISKVVSSIEQHISDPEFSVERLSDLMAMSRIHLHRKLKAITDQSASHFIRSIRLKRAKQLLEQNSATITEIAYQVGFNNISYFSKCFKEEFGALPSEFEA